MDESAPLRALSLSLLPAMPMAKPNSKRLPPLFTTYLAVVAILSFLTHGLSLAIADDFEGFDSDELEDDEATSNPPPVPLHPPPTTISQPSATPDSNTDSDSDSDSDPDPSPPSDLEIWDEDEFEGIPLQSPDPNPVRHPSRPSDIIADPPPPSSRLSFRSYAVEIAAVAFLVAFVGNYFAGRRENERIALAWIAQFATKDGVLDKSFSLVGADDGRDAPLLLKEGQDVVKFYGRGRRHCQGLIATMELRARHDLIARAFDLVLGRRDVVTFEVVMNEEAMDHVVMAVVRRTDAKVVQREERDLKRFGCILASLPLGQRLVAEDLVVISESKEVAGDLITNVVLDQVFGEKVFDKLGKWFISLHFSDQHPGSHKKMLIFKFALPDVNNMAGMTRLVALVPYYIDLIGRYKLSSQAHSKTEAARAKAAQEAYKELQNARQEVLQKRKAERRKLIEEAEAKLIAEVIRKKR